MNSPTGKQPQPSPQVTQAQQMLQLQEALANAAAHIQQLTRVLWLTVQAAGGKATLDESKVEPLWRLDKIRNEDGTLVLTSSVTPPPSGEEIDRLVAKLIGTRLRIEEVQAELGLENWPPDYLAFQLQKDRLVVMGGVWTDINMARGIAAGHAGKN